MIFWSGWKGYCFECHKDIVTGNSLKSIKHEVEEHAKKEGHTVLLGMGCCGNRRTYSRTSYGPIEEPKQDKRSIKDFLSEKNKIDE